MRVTVVQGTSRKPVPGAIASLIGTDGNRLAATLTDERGQATLEAQLGRRVRIFVESVGFITSRSVEFELLAQTRELEVALEARPLKLPPVVVRDRRRCETRPTSAAAAVLWEEIRKALTATTLATLRGPELAVWRYVRRLDASHRVIAETTSTKNVVGKPFVTASPRELVESGFVWERAGGTVYFAPDAELLLAESFVQNHCFGVRWDDGPRRLVGLTFEPQSRGRATPDIAGTLWLDARSADLRWMEFDYTNELHSMDDVRGAGRVEFERLPNGAWVVQRWYIRLPVMARVQGSQVGRLTTPARESVIGFREEGGWLTRAVGTIDVNSPMSELSGVVFDSLRGQPLGDVRIVLGGGVAEARTDSAGRYRLRHYMPGRYLVRAEHPRLAFFGSDTSAREASLTLGRTTTADWAIAGTAATRSRLCPVASGDQEPQRVVVAHVVDMTTGSPIVGVHTSTNWRTARLQRIGGAVLSAVGDSVADGRTDTTGFAAMCVGPNVRHLTVQAQLGGREVARAVSLSDSVTVAEVRLPLPTVPGRPFFIRAKVVARSAPDSAILAELLIPAQGNSYRTDRHGRVDIAGFRDESLTVVVRSPGYQPVITRLRPQTSSDSVRVFLLDRLPHALQVVLVEGTRSSDLRGFEERRAVQAGGTYISREDLASREGAKLSDVLRTVRGVRILRRPDGALVLASARGALSRSTKDCPYQIVLDGQRLYALRSGGPEGSTPPSIDEFAPAGLEAIEVYAGPAATPPQFGGLGAACGTIVLWTRR